MKIEIFFGVFRYLHYIHQILMSKHLNFRAFDHNGDGTISKDELKEAMQRFGHSFTEDECDEMFVQVSHN